MRHHNKIDFETTSSYDLTITASDGTLSDTATVTITVTNVNEAPTISDETLTLAENVADETSIGSITTGIDPDAGDTLSYSITSGNTNDAFAIDPSSGEITVNGNNKIDFETTSSYDLIITASDGTLSDTATFTITVNDVNEDPTISGTPTTTIAKDSLYTFTLMGGDVDVRSTLAYSINKIPTWATFSTTTGILTGTPRQEHIGRISSIVISLTSGGKTVSLPVFSITVTDGTEVGVDIVKDVTAATEVTITIPVMQDRVIRSLTLDFAGNNAKTATITVTSYSSAENMVLASVPTGVTITDVEATQIEGNTIEFLPGAINIETTDTVCPCEVTIEYDDSDLGGISEDDLVVYHFNYITKTWETLHPTSHDKVNNIITVTAMTLSPFAIGGVIVGLNNKDYFEITDISVWPNPASGVLNILNTFRFSEISIFLI